jgi:hypothetical protein
VLGGHEGCFASLVIGQGWREVTEGQLSLAVRTAEDSQGPTRIPQATSPLVRRMCSLHIPAIMSSHRDRYETRQFQVMRFYVQ